MRYDSKKLEEKAVLDTAARMCAAARTSPKTRGIDFIRTCVLTGEEKEALAQEMDRLAPVLETNLRTLFLCLHLLRHSSECYKVLEFYPLLFMNRESF